MRPSEILKAAGRPVAYYPKLAKPLGGINAAILFGHFFYWHDKTENPLGIYRTAVEIEEETGLSVQEQRTARAKLKEKGLLFETEKRIEHRIYYRLDLDAFDDLMNQHSGSEESTAPKCKINSPEMQNQHSGSEESTAPKCKINSPEMQNQHSGSEESTADEMQNQQPYKGTEDYQKTTTEDYNSMDSAPAGADAVLPVGATQPTKPKPKKSNKHADDLALLAKHGIDGQLAEDYLLIRKSKRIPLTVTGLERMLEAGKQYGMNPVQTVTYAVERGWASVTVEYLKNSIHGKSANQKNNINQIPQHTQGGVFLATEIIP